jgi:hypothetical protein
LASYRARREWAEDLAEETVADLGAIDLTALDFAGRPPAGALLLERDGMPVDEALRAGLTAADVDVDAAAEGETHTLRPVWLQRQVHRAVDDALDRLLGKAYSAAP